MTLSLNETSIRVMEADSSVEVCVRLEGELGTSVSAMLLPVPGDASGESVSYMVFIVTQCVYHSV